LNALFNILSDKIRDFDKICIIVVNKYPWVLPSIIGRVNEEFGIKLFLILTDPYNIEYVRESLQHIKDFNVTIISDYEYGSSFIQDNLIDTIFRLNKLFKQILENNVKEIVIDLTGSDSLASSAAMYSASRILTDRTYFTIVENIPLYGIPAYPGSPRWLHKLFIYGEKKDFNKLNEVSINYPKVVEWRGSRGIYIAFSKIINALTSTGYYESYSGERRVFSENNNVVEIYIHSNNSIDNKQKLIVIKESTGPDEETSRMLYNSWKALSDTLYLDYSSEDRQVIDRIIMQIQRYVGAADLVIKQISCNNNNYEHLVNEKLHRVLYKLSSDKQPIALVSDTNLFYQGIHMTLLKTSIKTGSPWSSIRGLNIYIPKCAETEINGKVAEINADSQGVSRLSYIMALLANRALLESKYYYGAEILNAVAQPCEVSVAVEASTLPESKILLVTADHKAFTAWQTLNICRGKVICIYIGHSDNALEVNNIYGRFYVSIAISMLLYVASILVPVSIIGSRDTIRLTVKNLRGTTAPVIAINRVKM